MTKPAFLTVRADRFINLRNSQPWGFFGEKGCVAAKQNGKCVAYVGSLLIDAESVVRLTFLDDWHAAEFALRYA